MVENSTIVTGLQALAHQTRLEVFLTLTEAGPDGRSAGALAKRLGLAPNALSFHLTRLRHAGLVRSRREGQRIVYAAAYERMEELVAYLGQRCCRESAAACGPICGGGTGYGEAVDAGPVAATTTDSTRTSE